MPRVTLVGRPPAAQNYFVVDVGKCDVFVKRDMGTEELVLTIGSGASFGEIGALPPPVPVPAAAPPPHPVGGWAGGRASVLDLLVACNRFFCIAV